MKSVIRILILTVLLAAGDAAACTSMIVSGAKSASGRPMIWKLRDTSAENNFLYRVEPEGGIGYVGLFNGGDSLALDEAWMGMNDAGFAIINTVAYNLPPNKPDFIDREGFVMAAALSKCRSVDDFEEFLVKLPKPMGVRTCFGVMDAEGNGAYFETDDYNIVRYNLDEAHDGVMVRTNFAYSGTTDEGMGYIRHGNVLDLLGAQISTGSLTPASLTEGVSRSFYNSLTRRDALEGEDEWIVDQDFVPRHSSTSSIVIEGLLPGETPDKMRMWANIGYPPCSHVVEVTLDSIPADVSATTDHPRSRRSEEADELKKLVFPISRGSGQRYINVRALREINASERALSEACYNRSKRKR